MPGPRARIEFSLFHLLVVTTVCAVLLGYLRSQDRVYHATLYCFRLPPSDDALVDWYESQQGVDDVRVTRKGNELSVHVSRTASGGIADRPGIPTPPMRELGYGVETIGFGNPGFLSWLVQRLQAFAGTLPIAGWGVVAILAVLGILMRRARNDGTGIKPIQKC